MNAFCGAIDQVLGKTGVAFHNVPKKAKQTEGLHESVIMRVYECTLLSWIKGGNPRGIQKTQLSGIPASRE